MGTDFLRSKREKHRKAWAARVASAGGDWLAAQAGIARVFRGKANTPETLVREQTVLLRLLPDNSVVASCDIHQVAQLNKPTEALIDCLRNHHGVVPAKVHRVLKTANAVDFRLEG